MKMKWGVIGCGGIADRRTLPGMMLADNAELIAVMDSNAEAAERVKEKYNAKYALDNVEELLAIDEIQAVYIASPVFCHKEQAFAAAKAGKHILLEKPMALTAEESMEIAECCKQAGVKLGVGLMMRFHSYHQEMKKLIAAGKLGEIVSMRAQLTCWYPDIPGNWRQNKALSGGGALMDMGIHCIDLLQYISGLQASKVTGFAETQTFSYNADDSATIVMKMNNNALAMVDANFNIPDAAAKCRLEFYGTKGSIMAEGTISQIEAGDVSILISDDSLAYDASQNREELVPVKLNVPLGNMYTKEIESFGRAVLNDTEPEITAADAIAVQKIVEQAYLASENGITATL
ncbi:MAG: Gfo/Idh/MocA family oxidoreductase [Lachnospiraceae bacterium]|nr:Gfo/Idh/MocA family oxidoreductase [Lachnospiraceae bacterium]